jgi:hypothetical protein
MSLGSSQDHGSVATAVQRGNGVAWLSGYSRALAAMAREKRVKGKRQDEEACVGESDTEDAEEQGDE